MPSVECACKLLFFFFESTLISKLGKTKLFMAVYKDGKIIKKSK